MLQTLEPGSQTKAIEELILEKFGKAFYRSNSLKKVRRKFSLTRIVLQDIIAECGTNATINDCHQRVIGPDDAPHPPLTPKALSRFVAVARYGRCTIRKQGYHPEQFVKDDIVLLASRLHAHLSSSKDA